MNFIWDKITEWLKSLLVGGIVSNLSNLFDSINTRVSDVAQTVGQTPQGWNGGIFNMIRNLSEPNAQTPRKPLHNRETNLMDEMSKKEKWRISKSAGQVHGIIGV